jgi:surfeit locus 1 family protein
MTRFRPRLGPTLFTAAVTVLCLALAFWQVQRLHWKEGLIAARAAALAAPPVAVPPDAGQAKSLALRRVTDQGVFLNDKETLINAIGPDGEAGFDVLTPLHEDSGRLVLVNRGFVPEALKDPDKRREGELSGRVRVSGLLRLAPASRPGWFTPDNRPLRADWYWIDSAAIAKADGLPALAPFYIDADATPNPGGWPKGRAQLPPLPNNHLQYAITWFALALAAVVVFVLSQRHEPGAADRERHDERVSRP